MARALREQWSDDDLARPDRQRANSTLLVEEDDEDLMALMAEDADAETSKLSQEDMGAYMMEQTRAEEAMAAINMQKATLREARWKQKQLKLGRGYFPPKPYQKGSGKGGHKGPCFRCNGPHVIADCPQKERWHSWQVQQRPSRPDSLEMDMQMPSVQRR